jgi:hypothetical protein
LSKPITTESLTLVTLLLRAIDRVKTQTIFDRDPSESRRSAISGPRLLKVLVLFQMLKDPSQRGMVRAVNESQDAQQALNGTIARNTLSNALSQREPEQMIEAWMMILDQYRPYLKRMGKKFARIAVVDASLIKLSLAAFDWATYRRKSGAAKITCMLDWMRGVPQQFVFQASGKIHDLQATIALNWCAGWTYLFDRGYFSFDLLTLLLDAGAHFVIRWKRGVNYVVVKRYSIPELNLPAGIGRITGDWQVKFPGWDCELPLRLVSYQLTDHKLIRVLTSRHDLSALSIAQLYKERWSIENWWRWLKRVYKVKEPLGRNENALQLQIVAAFVTDLLLRAFKNCSGDKGSLFEFVTTCQDLALVPLGRLAGNLRVSLSIVAAMLGFTEDVTDCYT